MQATLKLSLLHLCTSFHLGAGPRAHVHASPFTSARTLTSLAASEVARSNGKGLDNVAIVEFGSGCCHGDNSTKAAVRACNDAIEWASIKVRTIIPGGYAAMKLHVHIACPNPASVDVDAVANCFPYGTMLPILVEDGGLLGSSREGLPGEVPSDALMTVANACVTIGWNDSEEVSDVLEASPSVALRSPKITPQSSDTQVDESLPQVPRTVRTPTAAEMQPGSDEMLSRAADAKVRLSAAGRVLTPYEAFAFLGDHDDVEIYDVRTSEQRATHTINGCAGVSAKGSQLLPLDDIADGTAAPPPSDQPCIFICSRGPKSLVALDYLSEYCPQAMCVEGGITAWDTAALPIEAVGGPTD